VKKGGKTRFGLKGRGVDPAALDEVRALLEEARSAYGAEPRRRDLLIENLHRIQDRYGCLGAAHLAARADSMRRALGAVDEVATI